MTQIKFVKYNKTRNDRFQIKTAIIEENGTFYAEKTALKEEGVAHIQSFGEKYRLLENQNRSLKAVKPTLSDSGRTARFDYLKGSTLAELLGREIHDPKTLIQVLKAAMDRIYDVEETCISRFSLTPEFTAVFGSPDLPPDDAYAVSNIDGLFENIMVTEDGWYCLDYEWVFDFPVPLHFVQYRTLYYFYRKYSSLMHGITLQEFLIEFGIAEEMAELYRRMEECFQEYVHGENQQIYLVNFMKNYKFVDALEETDQKLVKAQERTEQLTAEVEEKDAELRKIREVQRLTNNHVTNLEIIIGDLRRENGVMSETIGHLNCHVSTLFRVRRKLGTIFNLRFPKGTRKRKILTYCKNTVLHPAEYYRMFTTPEGKNRIDGDFKIGDIYREHGKLRFPKQENPLVSIVIPVYNQIHYTYACLLSILDNTSDVGYEIIIADDVSADATAQLGQYAENLVICRNETNQGFIKNCNQAARAARGKYLMFLNNDTQVTEGWLSSLVSLIEQDPFIGMVGSKLVYPDGRLQEAGGIIWSDGTGWNYGRLDDPDKPEYNYVKDVDYISGAAILLPTKLWKQIGGFDERFAPAYCEDSDLAFEVRKAGYRVVYQPLSKVIHYEGISNGTDINGVGLKRYQIENSEKLRQKWTEEFKCQCVNNGNPNPFRARERSMGKDIILVVDHYAPTFDRDAGSKTTYQYLKMFLKKSFVIKFLGDNFLHEEPYCTLLQQMGIEILYGQEYQVKIWDWLKDNSSDISFAYLNRPHIAVKYMDYIKEHTDIKIIYYGHDLHFLREGREYALTGNIEKKRAADYWRTIEITLMRKAAVSYYPSYIERDAVHAIDERINVKAITAYVFDEFRTDIEEDFARREGLLFVGGFAHPPNADGVLWFAREIYPLIREKLRIPFYVVGSKVTDEIKALEQPGNGIVIKGFVSEEELSNLYGQCRIVVVPLRYGAGVKGKVVEAIYHGAPIVTTSIGAEGIPDTEDILIVRDNVKEFADETVSLYRDETRCQTLSQAAQKYIRNYFSLESAWKVIEVDFKR